MSTATVPLAFSRREVGIAFALALAFQATFFTILITAGKNEATIKASEEKEPLLIPIAVQPVLDDLPLLKLGSKKDKFKKKLPDIWKKQAPVKRYEERSAPSADAKDTVEKLPTTPLADKTHEAPPEDAEIAKQVDQQLEDAENKPAPELNEEGAADGVKEGTETDPLKARAVDLYKAKIAAWFNSRFRPPVDTIPCEELKALRASVSVQVGGDRSVSGFTVTRPSGNAVFDAKVASTMQNLVGQELPPPPPLYPDILGTTVFPVLSGSGACK